MTYNLLKFAFSAGEVSPTLVGRSDLENYDLAIALGDNWYVDYLGGLATREGTTFCEPLWRDDKYIAIHPFEFTPNVRDTNIIIFGDHYVRFAQDGKYFLDTPKQLASVQPDGTATTQAAHGFATGDWVKIVGIPDLENVVFSIIRLSSTSFQLRSPNNLPIPKVAATVANLGRVQRVFTITTPYPAEILPYLKVHQSRNLVRLTHPDFPIYNLERLPQGQLATGGLIYVGLPSTGIIHSVVVKGINLIARPVTVSNQNLAALANEINLHSEVTGIRAIYSGAFEVALETIYGTDFYNNAPIVVTSGGLENVGTLPLTGGINDGTYLFYEEEIGNSVPIPTGLTAVDKPDGDAGVGFAVTAVARDGQESLPSEMILIKDTLDYAVERGQVQLRWNAQPDVAYYNVYRTNIVPEGSYITRAMQLGFIGTSFGREFVDNNIIPDFMKTPPQHYNPFAPSQIWYVNVQNGGSGYSQNATASVSDATGSGASLIPIVLENGVVVAVVVVSGGSGYTNPTITISGGGGSGAVVSAVLSPSEGTYPAVSTVFQQRQIYAASHTQPLTLWGSRPRVFNNFDVSPIVHDGDSYEFDIESESASPIRHLFPMRSGLLVFTGTGVWQLTAGLEAPVTPTQALADPQSYQGCSPILAPLRIDADLLYVGGKGTTVRLLSYNDVFKVYSGQDVSLLASHFFDEDRQIISWAYAEEPKRLVHAVRQDGTLLFFTIVKDQKVFAWTQAHTQGMFKSVATLQEDIYDRTYTVVRRFIGGQWRQYLERFARRDWKHVEDAICVDSALTLPANYPSFTLNIEGDEVSVPEPLFTSDHVGWVIRVSGGKAVVREILSNVRARVEWLRKPTQFIPQTDIVLPGTVGKWTFDQPITEVYGLWHLEGMKVAILADGNVVEPQVVTNGRIFLPYGVTRVTVGLSYRCVMQTLPPTSYEDGIDHKRKNILGVYMRQYESRGLKAGADLDHLYAVRERTTEPMGEPIRSINGVRGVLVSSEWDVNGQTYIVQDDPLPAMLLGLVVEADVGDD